LDQRPPKVCHWNSIYIIQVIPTLGVPIHFQQKIVTEGERNSIYHDLASSKGTASVAFQLPYLLGVSGITLFNLWNFQPGTLSGELPSVSRLYSINGILGITNEL
jgi:hypothetical protein